MSDRRPLDWKKISSPSDWLAILSGTFFGSGLLPKMPGTWGTLAALPLAYYLNTLELSGNSWIKPLLWPLLLFAGTWAGKRFQELFGAADNQNIVMDEVVGLGITAWTAGTDLKTLAAAFVLFRVFDIVKVPPVRQVDLWSKRSANPWVGGFGVMADDVVAGFQGLIVILILQQSGFLAALP